MNLATFGNTFMTLTFSVLALALLLVYLPPQGMRLLRTTTPFWPLALILIALSGILYAAAPYFWAPLLTLANMTNIGSYLLLALIAASWNRRLSKRLLASMGVCFLMAAVVFEFWRQAGAPTFTLRVYFICSVQVGSAVWMVIELWHLQRRERSSQIRLMILLGCMFALANLFRIGVASQTADPQIANIYSEGNALFYTRIIILGSQVFLTMSFNNYFLEKLWRQERDASEHNQMMFETSPVAGVIWDDRMQITHWNSAAIELFGWSATEALGRDPVELLFPRESIDTVRARFKQLLERERLEPVVKKVQCKDGRIIYCEWSHRWMPRRMSRRRELVSMAVDVSDRLARERTLEQDRAVAASRETSLTAALGQTERDLRGAKGYLAMAADAAHLGIYERDVATDEIWVSDQWRELYGVGPAERIVEATYMSRLHPDDRVIVEQARADLRDKGEYDAEYRVLLANGGVRWIASRGRFEMNEESNLATVRAVSFDISLRKQAELDLQRQQREVAHLSRVVMLGELSGALAHELNQPLTAILSNAQAATRFIERQPVDMVEVGAILGDITGEARRAGEVIRRLRQLLSTGETQRQAVDLHELIAETLQLLRSDLMSQQVSLEVCLEAAEPLVHGDKVQLQQVIINIIMNACDAMKEVPPAARGLAVTTTSPAGGGFEVSFSDRGGGLPQGAADRIFDSFFSTKPSGMGLGLSVCRTIVSAHGGRLWAENREGGGATFHFLLPAGQNRAK